MPEMHVLVHGGDVGNNDGQIDGHEVGQQNNCLNTVPFAH